MQNTEDVKVAFPIKEIIINHKVEELNLKSLNEIERLEKQVAKLEDLLRRTAELCRRQNVLILLDVEFQIKQISKKRRHEKFVD